MAIKRGKWKRNMCVLYYGFSLDLLRDTRIWWIFVHQDKVDTPTPYHSSPPIALVWPLFCCSCCARSDIFAKSIPGSWYKSPSCFLWLIKLAPNRERELYEICISTKKAALNITDSSIITIHLNTTEFSPLLAALNCGVQSNNNVEVRMTKNRVLNWVSKFRMTVNICFVVIILHLYA